MVIFKYNINFLYIYIMKTTILMKRNFNGTPITQRSDDKFFNATELMKHYNLINGKAKLINYFWINKNTKDFMKALVDDLNVNNGDSHYLENDLYTAVRGINGGTYMHPYLFVKFSMWLSPEFEVQVIKWVYDNLIDFRTQAGDYYKEMSSAIQQRYIEYNDEKPDPLVFIKEANFLNELVFGDPKGKQRNEATEQQLDKLNRLQLANIKLIKSGIGKSKRKQKLIEFSELI